jgi:UDP-2,4-diacetamido-2,4,6-trideoxy-beta-L-altropyranose hydrolase
VRVACDPEDLAGRMFDADFAVTTASSTTYELMALGTPIVSILVADNQESIAAALRERDAATVLDSGADVPTIRDAIQTYMTEPSLRRRRRKYGRNLVDGQGAERVCTKILSLVDENTTT